MKKNYLTLMLLSGFYGFAQTDCNTVVINDTDEQNGTFIIGNNGQKAAADIPIAADQSITITGIKVTLASKEVPHFIHFRFYDNVLSVPEDPEVQPGFIPGETLFDFENTTVGEFEVIAYDEMHDFYIRNIVVELNEPIVLNGNLVQDRFWMGVISDANAWGSTAHYETGEGVVGESLAMGSTSGGWFQLINLEQLYELTAECGALGTKDFSKVAVNVSPNPANNVINISLPEGLEISKTEIYTMTGQKVKEITAGNENINVSGLAAGVYIIKAQTTDNSVYNGKFVKN
jgi:hypothetical protein